LMTDIEGSTRLLQELGDEYSAALAQHREALRSAFATHGGVEVDSQGDATFYAFARVGAAINAAVAGQRGLEAGPVKVRMGVHTGEPVVANGAYVGIDVHQTARITAAGHGGQVLVSETAARLLGIGTLLDLGEHRLKDVAGSQRLYQVGDASFPPLRTMDASNLPVAPGLLIGREADVATLVRLIDDGGRLTTITGPGGIGKTRLALQVASELLGRFRDGIFWVPMAQLSDPELVVPEIANTLGHKDVRSYLRDRELLLVLDNLEQVLDAGASLAGLLAVARRCALLATSRAPLRLAGEQEYPLAPLSAHAASSLFLERAQAVGRRVYPSEAVDGICRQLDALPLAIELAAARTKLMDPETLRKRLDRRLPLLTGGSRDAPERHQTLRSTIEWSCNLLDSKTRQLFVRLAVFADGSTIESAEAICEADLDSLGALVDWSLLKVGDGGRFAMLETLREYAAEQLDASHEGDAVHRAHAEFFAAFGARLAGIWRAGKDPLATISLDREAANLRAATDWAARSDDVRLLLRLLTDLDFLFLRGSLAEYRARLEMALARLELSTELSTEERRLRASGTATLSYVAYRQGDHATSTAMATRSLELAERVDDPRTLAAAHRNLANTANLAGRFEEARHHLELATEAGRAAGDLRSVAVDLIDLSDVALVAGDFEEAIALATEGVSVARPLGDPEILSVAGLNMATAYLRLDRVDEAVVQCHETIAFARRYDLVDIIGTGLLILAAVAAERGQLVNAARLIGRADEMRNDVASGLQPAERALNGEVMALLSKLGPESLANELDAGRTSSLEAVLEGAPLPAPAGRNFGSSPP
jgi:predicted ATPase